MTKALTDKELLELAAKAAEIEIYFDEDGDCYRIKASGNRNYWDPLNFDGDALRLAVKLRLSCVGVPVGYMTEEELADLNNDPYAFARRAIVRAAAELGKASVEIGKTL